MEFQEGLMKLMIHKPMPDKRIFERDKEAEGVAQTGSAKQRWKISLYKSSPPIASKPQQKQIPKEFICPLSKSLMADPVIVPSGHTFERACVQACKTLSFNPSLVDGTTPDFFAVIPNLALKSTILKWCKKNSIGPPKPLDFFFAENIVRTLMATQDQKPDTHNKQEDQKEASISEEELIQGVKENPSVKFNHAATELNRRRTHFYSSSEESVDSTASTPPLQLATQPSCYSSSSSPETTDPCSSAGEEELITKLRSQQVFEIEEAVISLRKITRTNEEDSRVHLCTPRLLSALRSLIISRYTTIQVNSVAALVNLSLEKVNKVKIVRSGIVPPLIDVLKAGFPEAQEHASGALFSLALDDVNKTAIGVLGALPPLLHLLRSESERTRHDSALALYHLSLVQSNRTKLVKLGSVPVLLGMVKSGHMTGRVLLILCNLASCGDGRAAMLDSGGVECLVSMLRESELNESTRESCVAVLNGLSHGGMRFKGLARAAGAEEVLRTVEKMGSEPAKEKARRMLELMKVRSEDEEEVDWEELIESGLTNRNRCRLGGGKDGSNANSSEF